RPPLLPLLPYTTLFRSPLPAEARAPLRISTRSVWLDQVWHLDGRRPGSNRADFSLDWSFVLADDSRFSDPRWADWREAAKLFLRSEEHTSELQSHLNLV